MTALETQLGHIFAQKGLTLATAESCTGGLLAGCITDVPGSSRYMVGGTVSYAYEAKELQLGVDHDALVKYGAVSKEIAIQMARGIRGSALQVSPGRAAACPANRSG
jgi:PncC family amidohydrolase